MTTRTRTIAAVLAAAALTGGSVAGIADAARSKQRDQAAGQARPGGQRGGPLPASALRQIADALGVSTADLRAALRASRPARDADGRRCDPEQFAADLAGKLGVEASAVREILDANRPARPTSPPAEGTPPARPDHAQLIAALASGLGIDPAAVQTAFDELDAAREADHRARETALYAALAEALDRTADEIRAAFEAHRPAPPAAGGSAPQA